MFGNRSVTYSFIRVLTFGLAGVGVLPAWVQADIISDRANFIFFESGGSELDQAARVQLDALAELLNSAPMHDTCLRLIGHADSGGSPAVNLRLSKSRAERVAYYLAARIVQPSRIVDVVAVGSEEPLDGYPASSLEQRRVELKARKCLPAELNLG